MFESFKAKKAARQQAKAQADEAAKEQKAEESLDEQRRNLEALIDSVTAEGTTPDELSLHRGELCFGTLTGCSLIEERKGQGHFVAGSAGMSIPIGNLAGRPIRYRVGATKGHYIQGEPSPTAIANGTLYITNQRMVFLSTTQTRECRYDHLVGIQRDDEQGMMTVSISNRQHPVTFSYGKDVASWVDLHVEIGMSRFRGDTDVLLKSLTDQLDELKGSAPSPASDSAGSDPAGSTGPAPPAPDPSPPETSS
jgi:hypothetical protein